MEIKILATIWSPKIRHVWSKFRHSNIPGVKKNSSITNISHFRVDTSHSNIQPPPDRHDIRFLPSFLSRALLRWSFFQYNWTIFRQIPLLYFNFSIFYRPLIGVSFNFFFFQYWGKWWQIVASRPPGLIYLEWGDERHWNVYNQT